MMMLVPADVLRPRRVDAHFAAEADAARAAGCPVAVVDHDALAGGGDVRGAVARVSGDTTAVYRGWMLSSRQYAVFAAALAEHGVWLRTSPDQYRRGHELPGWYPALAALTPISAWTTGTDQTAFDTARRSLGHGPAVLRDYSKSMKHHWHEAAYIPDLANASAAWTVAQRMRDLRGEDLTGGFVLPRRIRAAPDCWRVGSAVRHRRPRQTRRRRLAVAAADPPLSPPARVTTARTQSPNPADHHVLTCRIEDARIQLWK